MRYIICNTQKLLKFILALFVFSFSQHIYAGVPITTDSRIKTFIFNENEVYKLDFQYGYQSSIEFGLKESFETISVGNSNSWKITPVNRRIFIKPLDGDSKTNMTVITNKNVYHFDLHSHYPGRYLDNNLVYVARFFHPEKNTNSMKPLVESAKYPANKSGNNFSSSSYGASGMNVKYNGSPLVSNNYASKQQMQNKPSYNYNYTLTGPEQISPMQIFDDGSKTYFLLNNIITKPEFYSKSFNGNLSPIRHYKMGKYVVVDKISQQFVMKNNGQQVNIYKESN